MSTGGIGGGKRSANAELNLVPYIDLLSTLICFLLLTAVYQQISSLSTQGAPPTPPAASDSVAPLEAIKKVQFRVSVLTDRLEMAIDDEVTKIPYQEGEPDFQAMLAQLSFWKAKYPERKDVTLNTAGETPYKYLIKAMDTLVQGEFEDIGVNTN